MEKDDETYAEGGTAYDFGARVYSSRLGRWLAIDPLMRNYPSLSPYNFVANSPLVFVDPDGKEIVISKDEKTQKSAIKIQNALAVLKEVDPDKYNQLDESDIVFEISVEG